MRLKCIKLAGFKSFVDPTSVSFPGNLCALVGPNGCGKSNVIDAVRWVMGESSARNLRGESMADVIFAGSISRPPVGQASIELVFDNQDGTIGGEYADYAEISIKRLVGTEGQSTFFMNGVKCRRRDITEIFLGTGLGPRSYAIIEQGVISRLIESKPEELRVFIEEAAGISRYRERRRETENRLRRTQDNMERLTDLREELERQLQHLQRQARSAEKYGDYKTRERTLRAQLLALQWRQLEAEHGAQLQRVGSAEVVLESAQAQRTSADRELETLRQAHTEATERFNEVQASYYSLGGEVARIEQELKHQRERAGQLAEDLKQVEKNCAEAKRQSQQESQQQRRLQRDCVKTEAQLKQLRDVQRQSAAQWDDADAAMQSWQREWDEHHQQSARPGEQVEVQRSRIEHLEEAGQRLQQRIAVLERERQQSRESTSGEADCRELAQQVALREAELVAGEARVGEQWLELDEARQRREQHSEALDQSRQQLQTMRGRLASLEALQQAAMEPGDGVALWLQHQRLADRPRLLETLEVETGWHAAVETVLGDYLQAVCVEQIDQLQEALREPPPDGSLSLLEAAADTATGSAPTLADKVSGGGDYPDWLKSVMVAEDLPEALRQRHSLAAGQSVITRDGIWLGGNWVRVTRATEAGQGVIERRREMEQLQSRVSVQEQQCREREQALTGTLESLERIESEHRQAQAALQTETRRLAELSAELSAGEARVEQAAKRDQMIHGELEELRRQLASEQAAMAEAQQMLAAASEALAVADEQRQHLLSRRQPIRSRLDAVAERAQRDRDSVHQAELGWQSMQAQRDALAQSVERTAGQIEKLNASREKLQAAISQNDAPREDLQSQLQQQLQLRSEVEAELTAARGQVDEQSERSRQVETRRAEIEQLLQTRRSELEQHKLDLQTLQVQREGVQEKLQEFDQQADQLLEDLPEGANPAEWQERLDKVGRQIERLGLINLAAIDEYRQHCERKQYLDSQNADLENALATLQAAIRKIDRETRSRFRDTFDQVNTSLGQFFPRVFGGGTACLEMTGKDLLDTGITIMAHPPGKKNATIHQLSGGEKALVAIALVFSIFRLNPAPFCMLDEVDAPLDDVNAARYARMVKEMSEQVQFIFVTHNKITMEMADQLLGVTMQEPGVSRLVSVDVEEAVELAVS